MDDLGGFFWFGGGEVDVFGGGVAAGGGGGGGGWGRGVFDLDEDFTLQVAGGGEVCGVFFWFGEEEVAPGFGHDGYHGELLFGAAVDLEGDDEGGVGCFEGCFADCEADFAEGDFFGEGVAVVNTRFLEGEGAVDGWACWAGRGRG